MVVVVWPPVEGGAVVVVVWSRVSACVVLGTVARGGRVGVGFTDIVEFIVEAGTKK